MTSTSLFGDRRRKGCLAIAAASGALLLLLQHSGGASGLLSPSRTPVPNDKAAAVGKSQDAKKRFESTGMGYIEAFGDVGPGDEIAKVKIATVGGIDAIKTAMRLPSDLGQRSIVTGNVLDAATRRESLARTMDPAVSGPEIAEIESALALAATQPGYRAYQDNKFVVDKWQGIRVENDRALAVLLAHDTYLVGSEWTVDPVKQFQVELTRVDAEWRITSRRSLHLEDHSVTVPGRRP